MAETVLIIEPEGHLADLTPLLSEAGFQVIESRESADGLHATLTYNPQIIIVEEEAALANSKELVATLCRLSKAPIVVVGAGGEGALIQAVLQGADLYLTRPLRNLEFIARIRALLRRQRLAAGLGAPTNVVLSREQMNQILAQLSDTERRLFCYLLERRGRLVSKDELVIGVWGRQGRDTSLRFYIRQLRCKLTAISQIAPIEILNRKCVGYLMRVQPPLVTEQTVPRLSRG